MSDPLLMSAAIALLVSVNFGLASHVQHIGLDHMDVRTGTLINIATTAVGLWLLAPLFLVPDTLWTPSAALFALAGLIVPAVSISFATASVKMIGPGLTSGLSATTPVFAMLVAITLLGERVTMPIVIGTLIVIVGVMGIAWRPQRGPSHWPLWALALPFGAALTRGISHPVIKMGLEGLPSPLTAGLVSSSVSLLVLGSAYLVSGRRLPPWNVGYGWFILCGLINGAGIVGLAVALDIGHVVIVSPLIATAPAFTLLLGAVFFKRETIGWRIVAAIAVIVAGCLLIVMR